MHHRISGSISAASSPRATRIMRWLIVTSVLLATATAQQASGRGNATTSSPAGNATMPSPASNVTTGFSNQTASPSPIANTSSPSAPSSKRNVTSAGRRNQTTGAQPSGSDSESPSVVNLTDSSGRRLAAFVVNTPSGAHAVHP
jgi:methionine-rich copper-binding protein CopC